MSAEHIALWIPAVISVIAAIYSAGILAQTVRTHEKRLNAHSSTLKEHGDKHGRHEVTLEGHTVSLKTLTAWHDGFTAGAHRG